MTTKIRAPFDFGGSDAPTHADALSGFDPKAFVPEKPRLSNNRPDKEALRKAGELSGFVSREGGKPTASVKPHRRRNFTGRSEQVNIKATPEFKARFQALAAKNSWTDAVTFEKAIEFLEGKYE